MTKHVEFRIQDSLVSIATGHGLDDPGSIPSGGRFFFLHSVHTGSETHPASDQIGTGCFFPGIKKLGREANCSTSSSAKVKNEEAVPILLHMSCHSA